MGAISEARKRATDKYLEKFDEIRIRVPKGNKEVIQAYCEAHGESMNAFFIRVAEQEMTEI